MDTWKETMKHPEKYARMQEAVRQELGLPEAWSPSSPSSSSAAASSAAADDPSTVELPPQRGSKEAIFLDCMVGHTCLAPSNSFTPHTSDYPAERIDFIHYVRTHQRSLQCQYVRLALVHRIPGLACSYSDHYGLEARFTITPTGSSSRMGGSTPFYFHRSYFTVVHRSCYTLLTALGPSTRESASFHDTEQPMSRNISTVTSPVTPIHELSYFLADDNERHHGQHVDLYRNVLEVDVLPSVIKLLTWGVKDARQRARGHALWSYFFLFQFLVALVASVTFASISWDSYNAVVIRIIWIVSLLLAVFGIAFHFYRACMVWFVLPEELSAMERIRSEVVLWVRGHPAMSFSDKTVALLPEIPVGNDAAVMLDIRMVNTVFGIAGIPINAEDGFITDGAPNTTTTTTSSETTAMAPPPAGGGYASVLTEHAPTHILGSAPAAGHYQQQQNRFPPPARPQHQPHHQQHQRKMSYMADPGPYQISNDMAAINAISSALRFGSKDHPSSVVDAMGNAIQDLKESTQRLSMDLKSSTQQRLGLRQSAPAASASAAASTLAPTSVAVSVSVATDQRTPGEAGAGAGWPSSSSAGAPPSGGAADETVDRRASSSQ